MGLRMAPVRQRVVTERVPDAAGAVREGLRALPLSERVRPGMRVAVGVGSRGISCITEVVMTVVNELRALGAQPFLVPAMGSHGGGTAEGQRQVLEDYGLGPSRLGIPIQSDMEAVQIGETEAGVPIYFDRFADDADGIVIVNRIKEHTSFRGAWESGLMKMLAVGLGKRQGAATYHARGVGGTFPAVARAILAQRPVLFGVGIVENGLHEPARIAVIPAERIEVEEPRLLDLARQMRPGIPLDPLDLLIVQEMGKNISGTGMDLNVIGMWRRLGGPVTPDFKVIAALDLTANSHGNAIGVGHADLITQRLRDKIDVAATYTNCLTAGNLAGGKIPITLPTDRAVIDAAIAGIGMATARVVWIRNTLTLDTLWASEALLPDVAQTPGLEQLGEPADVEFDARGALILPSVSSGSPSLAE
ncbi:MAG: lactate racemase domain-containing protein [Anaerolineae bacterium]